MITLDLALNFVSSFMRDGITVFNSNSIFYSHLSSLSIVEFLVLSKERKFEKTHSKCSIKL